MHGLEQRIVISQVGARNNAQAADQSGGEV
jgi:hypothetical protein